MFGGGSSNNLGGGSGSNLGGVSGSNLGGGSGSNLGAGGSSSDFGFNFTQDDAETKSEFAMFFGGEGAGDGSLVILKLDMTFFPPFSFTV